MTDSTAVRNTSQTTLASTPLDLVANSIHNRKLSQRLRGQMSDELTEWINVHKYRIPVREPAEGDVVRTNTDDGQQYRCPTVTDDVTGEVYRVDHDLIWKTKARFVELYGMRSFTLAISRDGSMFLWPIDSEDLFDAIQATGNRWVEVTLDGGADIRLWDFSQRGLMEPIWPDLLPREIIDMGFQSRVIERLDHPLIQRVHARIDSSTEAMTPRRCS